MCSNSTSEELDEEIKELLLNYKHKRATVYEPCTRKNFRECLIGLSEEFDVLNIKYVFNPHNDVDKYVLGPEALVKLINSVWTLLHYHKNLLDKTDKLTEQNHVLEHNNKQLNDIVNKLKQKLNAEKNESKACVASVQKIADNSDNILRQLTEARAKYVLLSKQKDANERNFKNEITRLKLENEKLLHRIRGKNAPSCSETCDMTVQRLKEKQKHQQKIISQLQKSNQQLLQEVLDMKEEYILAGLEHNLDFKKESKK